MFGAEAVKELAESLTRNKLRTLLTALGVFWGIFVLVIMLGMGRGLEGGVEKNLGLLATRSLFVWGQRTSLPFRGLTPGRHVRFENADIAAVRSVPGVEHVAPRLQLGGWRDGAAVTAGSESSYFPVLGDVPEFARIEGLELTRGRFVNQADLDEARKVAVIGEHAREVLFGTAEPIGRYLAVRGVYFQIVGELTSTRKGEQAERIRTAIFVPFSTFQQAFNQRDRVGWFALSARADHSAELVEQGVKRALAERHRIHPDDPQGIGAWNSAKQYDRVQGLFRGIRWFVWFVGSMTLLAGVLGVSNILLISVKERTREIGVRKALGATPGSIIGMVVREALVLTSLAGYLGLVAGVGALELLTAAVARLDGAPINQPRIELGAALAATLVLVVAGTLAGIVPARHAARISPVEALRSE